MPAGNLDHELDE